MENKTFYWDGLTYMHKETELPRRIEYNVRFSSKKDFNFFWIIGHYYKGENLELI